MLKDMTEEEYDTITEKNNSIELTKEDLMIEPYLVNEYNVISNDVLRCEEMIPLYYELYVFNIVEEYSDVKEKTIYQYCKIKNAYFKVIVFVEYEASSFTPSSYWDYTIKDVSYIKIDKPKPKPRKLVSFDVLATEEEKIEIDQFFRNLNLKYEIYKVN